MNKLELIIDHIDSIKYIKYNIMDNKDFVIAYKINKLTIMSYNSYFNSISFYPLQETYDQLNADEKNTFIVYIENKFNIIIKTLRKY